MKLVHKISAGYALILLLMVGLSTVSYNTLKSVDRTFVWVKHTHEVIDMANLTGMAMINMETGLRGFLVTGKENYLEPYYEGIKVFNLLIEQGKKKTSDNPVAVHLWIQIKSIEVIWSQYAQKMIEMKRELVKGNISTVTSDDITKEMEKGVGKVYMDQIRVVLKKLIDGEKELLEQREKAQKYTMMLSKYFAIIGNLLTIIIGGIIAFLIYRNINRSLGRFQNGLMDFFDYLKGKKDEISPLNDSSNDEIGVMSSAINDGIKKVKFTMDQNKTQSWIKNGINELNQILINTKETKEICSQSINFLSTYTNAGVGIFYIYDEKEKLLVHSGDFAHVQRDEFSSKIKLNEGVVGQVAVQKKPILHKDINTEDALITTGTITQPSYNTYTFPLVYNEKLYGVIEIGSFEPFSKKTLEFFTSCEKTICIALINAIHNK